MIKLSKKKRINTYDNMIRFWLISLNINSFIELFIFFLYFQKSLTMKSQILFQEGNKKDETVMKPAVIENSSCS